MHINWTGLIFVAAGIYAWGIRRCATEQKSGAQRAVVEEVWDDDQDPRPHRHSVRCRTVFWIFELNEEI